MQLLVDQQESPPDLIEGCENFGQVFRSVEDSLMQRRRLIGGMELLTPDGEEVQLSPREIAELPLAQVGKISFTTISIKDFATHEIANTRQFLPSAVEGFERVSELFNQRELAEALTLLGELTDGLRMFLMAVTSIQDAFGLDLDTIEEKPGQSVSQCVDSLNQILADMVEGLENRDFVLVNDYLTYELLPHLKGWDTRLVKISEAIP